MSSISVVIPTIGRRSLKRTLKSIIPQMDIGDEVIVVADGPCKYKKELLEGCEERVRYFELPVRTNDWGGAPRNVGVKNAIGNYIAFMDDDDAYLPGAFKAMHDAIDRYYSRTFLFRMMHTSRIIWEKPELAIGNVSTQMILMPNEASKIPLWEGFYEADFKFISEVVAMQPSSAPIMWMDSIIAELKEHANKKA